MNQRPKPCRRALTIVELLVVVALVVLLMGLLVPALKGVRASGRQTAEATAARQLMAAYISYANVSRDRVLPGYNTQLPARDAAGQPITSLPVRARYPWRIAPFLDYKFEGLYLNEHAEYIEQAQQEDAFLYTYLVSLFPSLGLNTMWVGGDEDQGGFDPASAFGRFYVTSLSEVRRASDLIVFASARGGDSSGLAGIARFEGYFKVLSPYATTDIGYQWSEEYVPQGDPADFGFVSARHNGAALVAAADAHVELLTTDQLKDMRRWANQATQEDWTLDPMPTSPVDPPP